MCIILRVKYVGGMCKRGLVFGRRQGLCFASGFVNIGFAVNF